LSPGNKRLASSWSTHIRVFKLHGRLAIS
jgi:hypothetical protein